MSYPMNLKETGFTSPAQAMPNEFKDVDPIVAYRNYYIGTKLNKATWKNREVPAIFRELLK
jgi:hypothetical protein